MYPTCGRWLSCQRYEVLSFQPTFRGSFQSSFTSPGVSPVCHRAFLRNSPGPVRDFTACRTDTGSNVFIQFLYCSLSLRAERNWRQRSAIRSQWSKTWAIKPETSWSRKLICWTKTCRFYQRQYQLSQSGKTWCFDLGHRRETERQRQSWDMALNKRIKNSNP